MKNVTQLVLLLFGPHDGSFGCDSLETGLDALDRAPRVAGHALQEEQPRLLVQDGVGRPAGMAGDVLLDVPPQHVLDVLLLETAFHDELAVAVDGAHGAQLGRQEGQKVLWLPVEAADWWQMQI